MSSKIEWTEDTWNPLLGCSKVSPGCKNCYAIRTAWIRSHNPKMKDRYAGIVVKTAGGAINWTGEVKAVPEVALKPLKTKKPTIFFVNSMSDLFHEAVPFKVIDQVFAVMALCPQHTFQVLTKRPARMLEYMRSRKKELAIDNEADTIAYEYPDLLFIGKDLKPHLKSAGWMWYADDGQLFYSDRMPLPNVWLGVSVENQAAADERIPLLLQVPAAVRFLSCEPLLGSVDLQQYLFRPVFNGAPADIEPNDQLHWVICGGESGPSARPMHPHWAISLRDQCDKASVPFFFKQWGEYYTDSFSLGTTQGHFRMFRDFQHWINKASTWVRGGRCISVDGRECKTGADFEACAYPVAIMDKVGKKEAGRLLDGMEWNGMPK